MDQSTVHIRVGTLHDVAQIKNVLVRSVYEICAKDYDNDQAILESWCKNKTDENITAWIAKPENYFIVAEDLNNTIVGVGLYQRDESSIDLCYVLPEVLGRGMGTQMLLELEAEAKRFGCRTLYLCSSLTARAFYEKHGYQICGLPMTWNLVTGHPMKKELPTI